MTTKALTLTHPKRKTLSLYTESAAKYAKQGKAENTQRAYRAA